MLKGRGAARGESSSLLLARVAMLFCISLRLDRFMSTCIYLTLPYCSTVNTEDPNSEGSKF